MFTVTITEKGGKVSVREFDQPEITIGRIQGNDIVLPKSNVSKRHARIINNGSSFVVIDSKSTNGTYVNGKRIDAPYDMRAGDKVFVGDYTMELEAAAQAARAKPSSGPPPPPEPSKPSNPSNPGSGPRDELLSDEEWGGSGNLDKEWEADWGEDEQKEGTASESVRDPFASTDMLDLRRKQEQAQAAQTAAKEPPRREAKEPRDAKPEREVEEEHDAEPAPRAEPRAARPATPAKPAQPANDDYARALSTVHERLLKSLDLRRMDVEKMGDEELRKRAKSAIEQIVKSMGAKHELPEAADPSALIADVLNEALGLGPLEDLLHDETVTEILVNGAGQIYVERSGKLEMTERTFSSNQAVLGVIERIVAPVGRRIDESSPMVDARLKDGSRVNAIIPPLALRGPTLTIRKFTREPLQVDDMVGSGTLTGEMAEFLEMCVKARRNILISGGTGSGKTTTLNVLSGYIPEDERILTIEDAAELKLDQAHVVSLESRPPNMEGRGAVTIRDLVRNALRMRPDRIVVGECRGGEALDMLQAMNTGHEGSLTTVHANSPRDALSRLETMVLMSGMDLPMRAIRDQIASAINVIVHQARLSDGTRRITHISELTGMETDVITMQDIFIFEREGFDAKGAVKGRHRPTGFVPKFYESLKAMGLPAKLEIFRK